MVTRPSSDIALRGFTTAVGTQPCAPDTGYTARVDRRLSSFAALLLGLGPWAAADRVPRGVRREHWVIRRGPARGHRAHVAGLLPDRTQAGLLDAYVYHPPARPIASYLIAPGLHFLGPDDPRLDRFCRVLGRAGFRVVAPFLPAFVDLLVEPSAADDLELCARASLRRFSADRITLFSISFGSWPALETAARLGNDVDAVITFGGYARFESAVRFCIDGVMRSPDGNQQLARDPLNSPALFLNMLPYLEPGPETRALEAAWRQMTYRTWGKMELKQPGRLEPFARELCPSVPPAQRELFLIGCGVVPGAGPLVESALERAGDAFAFASPAPALARIECPVVICHGKDDDVIPWGEALELGRALERRVPTELLLTGLYGHTGAGRPSLRLLAREARTMSAIARALSRAGQLRDRMRR
jgi:pimeloyl-ACP methyl ester carboxylesterase